MAKKGEEKAKSPAELLAEQMKEGKVKRNVNRGPSYVFPTNGLKATRDHLGLKQSIVADECGIDGSSLSAIEKGADPRLSTALRLAGFFGKPVNELFGGPLLKDAKEIAGGPIGPSVAQNATEPPAAPMFLEDDEAGEGQRQ